MLLRRAPTKRTRLQSRSPKKPGFCLWIRPQLGVTYQAVAKKTKPKNAQLEAVLMLGMLGG